MKPKLPVTGITTCLHLHVRVVGKQKIGKELVSVVKITLPQLIDIRDYPACNLWVVCHGRALMVWTPSVPRWMSDDSIHQDTGFNFHHSSDYFTESHKADYNEISQTSDRQIHKTLLILPEGRVFTSDVEAPMTLNGCKVQKNPCQLEKEITHLTTPRKHVFRPISWIVRDIAKPREYLDLDDVATPLDPFDSDSKAGTKLG